ncbi:YHS domain-containing (seleno)protein [Marinomonas flavescens]|uniref:YHS domain-containing (seleno)protein n=1 Tax=Marinomonas flavescens TaxID=2529379 RepID=UPI00105436FA|nr:YHS domain-containing (seleno)protein [Marinomonas flavescens]
MKKYFLSLLLLISSFSYAQDLVYTGYFNNKALSGYDTVAYFTDNKPVVGDKKFVTKYKGADWYFANEEHLAMFKLNPEKYAPQYGGYCAWAIGAQSSFASADPEQWAIVNGKLYLNYDADIKAKWDKDPSGFIEKADKVWPKLISE